MRACVPERVHESGRSDARLCVLRAARSKGFSESVTWFKFLVIGVVLTSGKIISRDLLNEVLRRNVESMLHAPRIRIR
jgi:hypothetical protein